MADDNQVKCTDPDCTFATDGHCKAGTSPVTQCQNLREPDVEELPVSDQMPRKSDLVDLPKGDALSPDAASLIMAARESRVILLAGVNDCGKTTLLASLFEKFQAGPFAGFHFAGSKSLVGFEKRCFLSRMASERETPDTQRTEFGDIPDFLHLRVADVSTNKPLLRDLLFTDISGEVFRLARDLKEENQKLSLLKQADRVLLLVDGAKVADLAMRDVAVDDSVLLLRRSVESGMLGVRSQVDVLLTKLDVVESSANRDSAMEFWNRTVDGISTKYRSRLGGLRFFATAARPEAKSNLSLAHGLVEPFADWVRESLLSKAVAEYPLETPPTNREFNLFSQRAPSKLKVSDGR